MTNGLEAGKSTMGVRGGEAMSTAVDERLGELGLGVKGVDGRVEVPNLVLIFAKASDVGGETPVPEFASGFLEMGEVGAAALKETEEPWA